jgi:hypothetical protein
MRLLRSLAAVILSAGCLAMLWSALVVPVRQAWSERTNEIAALHARLVNLAKPAAPVSESFGSIAVLPSPAFLAAATGPEAASSLAATVQTLLPPEANLISAVPAGSVPTPYFTEERLNVALRIPDASLAAFVSSVESHRPSLRFGRLSIRHGEARGIVLIDAGIIAYRKPDAPKSDAPASDAP